MPALVLVLIAVAATGAAAAADATDPLWPCMQRLVPTISAAALWDGPALEDADWRADPAVAPLVPTLLEAEGPAAEAVVARFAAAIPEPERAARLTLLFAGLIEDANRRRAGMIAAIRKHAAGLNALADQINDLLSARGRLLVAGTGDGEAAARALEADLYWLQRVFDGRRKAQPFLCEEPVLAEHRLGVLARAILNALP